VGSLSGLAAAPSAHRARGFTLIEILVVVAIIAITAGIAVIASDRDDRGTATREAKRLAGALEYASARAQSRAETLGVSAEGSGWRFWRRAAETSRWSPVTDDDVLVAHAVPDGLTVIPLSFAGQPLPPDAIVPLRASGHNEPFAFLLRGKTSRIVLSADPLNRVSLLVDTEAP
jgi:general secretion pathway protein H